MSKIFSIVVIIAFQLSLNAQKVEFVDASNVKTEVNSGMLKMGNPGIPGKKLLVNNRYITLDGKPITPVMGEVHFSRLAESQWEDAILKMKACGINIVAAYVFWNHHEEIEGQFDWSGNKNLRKFAKLVAKHELWFYPRIGPWAHGEARNGGTPDWILTKSNIENRTNDPVYQHYAEEWYRQVALQLKDLLYKDGGPVIGIQIENEYRWGEAGIPHIAWLKSIAVKHGFDVPMYTVTGWGAASVPAYEVIPLWGAYPDAPWATNLDPSKDCDIFKFMNYRGGDDIGNENRNVDKNKNFNSSAYPYFTCEMGVGIMNTDHRRLRIDSIDGLGLVTAKLGSGSNLIGYYVFTGGSNVKGILTTNEENRELGNYNTNPVVSYDFQAAIRESGKLNGAYYEVKKAHYLMNEFGDELAAKVPVLPKNKSAINWSVRADDESAFLFCVNYCRNNITPKRENAKFSVKLKNETITFPKKGIDIQDSAMFIWPLNFDMGIIKLKYATSQPLCNLGNKWVFIQDAVSSPEFCFHAKSIQSIQSTSGKVERVGEDYLISGLKPSINCVISIQTEDGEKQEVVVLSKQEAKQAWLFNKDGSKYFFVSDANLYMNESQLHVYGSSNQFTIHTLNDDAKADEFFTTQKFSVPAKTIDFGLKELKLLSGAKWLKTGVEKELDSKSILMHRFFMKEFNLGNPSKVRKANLIIAAQSDFQVQINGRFVNSEMKPNTTNIIDLTGYVSKGDNTLLLDFPFEYGELAFKAKLVVEYYNSDKISVGSDQSWITKDQYNFPSIFNSFNNYEVPEIMGNTNFTGDIPNSTKTYSLTLPNGYMDNLSNVYLNIEYSGAMGRIYFNHNLIADDFYSGAIWQTGLNRLNYPLENQSLTIELTPLKDNARVYFDDLEAHKKANKAVLEKASLVPEYQINLRLTDKGLQEIN
jgi:Glycosyl hydrolases family 35